MKSNKVSKKQMRVYSSRNWLNKPESPSTGSCVAYHGEMSWRNEFGMFFEVSDCHNSARLHKTHTDTVEDFIGKMRTLAKSANDFADWLEKNYS